MRELTQIKNSVRYADIKIPTESDYGEAINRELALLHFYAFERPSRRRPPRVDGREGSQHVTIHLADSLPRKVLSRLRKEVELLPESRRRQEFMVRLHNWIDSGSGSCLLREPEIAAMMEGVLQYFDKDRYTLFDWVVMPNHVHVLFKPLSRWKASKIVASWKEFSAQKILEWTIRRHNERRADHPVVLSSPTVWHREHWNCVIRDEAHFQRVSDYIRHDPVKAGLVEAAERWRWRSASD